MRGFIILLVIMAAYVFAETYQHYRPEDQDWKPSQEAIDKINELSNQIDEQMRKIQ